MRLRPTSIRSTFRRSSNAPLSRNSRGTIPLWNTKRFIERDCEGILLEPRMVTIGLTGGLGTGKSTVAKMFGRHGARVIDADQLARKSLKRGGVCYGKVVQAFGGDILEGKDINRQRLAAIVFRSPSKLRQL